MVNASTPQGEPILGTGGERKNYIMYIVLDRLASHLAEIVKLIKECNSMLVEFRLRQPWPQTFVSTESIVLVSNREIGKRGIQINFLFHRLSTEVSILDVFGNQGEMQKLLNKCSRQLR